MINNAFEIVDNDSVRRHVLICYTLMLFGSVTGGITNIISIIWAYFQKDHSHNTIYYSHFENIIATFWISFVLFIISAITFIIGIGWIVSIFSAIYCFYRYIKGMIKAIDRKIYQD